MRPSLLARAVASVAILAVAACSRSSEQPVLADDLKEDLARVAGTDIQLAGSAAPRLQVVSAAERHDAHVPAPKAPELTRTASARRGVRAAVRSVHQVTPAASAPAPVVEEAAPAEVVAPEPAPEPVPRAAGRPEAPRPSTQPEPAGGWKSPSQIIRNAPFPINPARASR